VKRMCTPHVLRHTFACQALLSGMNIRTLQRRLGHSSLEITAKYLKFLPEELEPWELENQKSEC